MLEGILGKKVGMTQIFVENGNCIPVTVIETGPCFITGIKTKERDGYQGVQLGYGDIRKKNIKKPQLKNLEKCGVAPKRILKEFPCKDPSKLEVGKQIGVDIFNEGDFLNISGISKGKGFTGVIKRHGFSGAPASRGAHESYRGGGSIGMCVHPGKVFKGKKMAGRHGNAMNTILNLEVVRIQKEQNLLMVKGAAPGPNGGILIVKKSNRKSKNK